MTVTVYYLTREDKKVKVYFVSEAAEDFSEVIYQEYETEGYSVENSYAESAKAWGPEFIQKVYDTPYHMHEEGI